MGKDIELAILFADVVGSTRLYELMGDLRARDMVSICIDVMRSATERSSRPWAMRSWRPSPALMRR
jgi:class 3 adenylate cyclase